MPAADILQFPHPGSTAAAVASLEAPDAPAIEDVLLCNRLHRHLEIYPLLEQFVRDTANTLAIQFLGYRMPDSQEFIAIGTQYNSRTLHMHLHHAGHYLGEIEILTPLSLDVPLSRVLAPLIVPLHNAMSYHRMRLLSQKDALTGLGNRAALETALATEAARAERHDHPFTLLVVDIDHFKSINDTLGHSAGDLVLRMVAMQIQDCLRPYDQAFRYGGEEFVILLGGTGLNEAKQIAERIRHSIATQGVVEAKPRHEITVSIGAGEMRHKESIEALFDRADQALYRAKNSGRNRVIVAA